MGGPGMGMGGTGGGMGMGMGPGAGAPAGMPSGATGAGWWGETPGPRGERGPVAPTGPLGDVGPAGDKGDTGATGPAHNPAETVPFDHWAYDAAQSLTDSGIIVGYPDGTFRGDRTMTRDEFAAAVSRLTGDEAERAVIKKGQITRYAAAMDFARLAAKRGLKLDPSADCPFNDVPATHPARASVLGLVALTIIPGEVTFNGNQPLLRKDFAQWATALLAKLGLDLKGRDAMQVMKDEGILQGFSDGSEKPDQPMQWESFLVALARLVGRK